MAAVRVLPVAVLLLLSCLVTSEVGLAGRQMHVIKPGEGLAARLQGEKDGGLMDCWNALLELKSCTNEIILFFLNGDSYLTMECCRAIRIMTHGCWPSMLNSLGFTSEEGDILRGYCGGSPPPQPDMLEGLHE